MFGAGLVDDLQVPDDTVRPVEQERGHRIRDPRQCCRFARDTCARGVEIEAAPGAARVLRLQQHVAVVPPLAAHLDGVTAHQLGHCGRDIPGLLGPIPWLAGRESQERVGIAADEDRGQAARELVDIRARDADVGARGQPVAFRPRDVVVVVHAAANVHDHRVAEHARPVHCGTAYWCSCRFPRSHRWPRRRTRRRGPDRTRPAAGSSDGRRADSSRSSPSSASCRRRRSSSREPGPSGSCSGRAARRRCWVPE